MAMPGKNIIITNLLFQQTAIAYFLLQWTQHSYLVRMKDCFLDQLQKFQAEKRKLKDEQPLTLTSLFFDSSLQALWQWVFFPFWLKRSKTCHSVTTLHSHIFAQWYFIINPQKNLLETPLLNYCTTTWRGFAKGTNRRNTGAAPQWACGNYRRKSPRSDWPPISQGKGDKAQRTVDLYPC